MPSNESTIDWEMESTYEASDASTTASVVNSKLTLSRSPYFEETWDKKLNMMQTLKRNAQKKVITGKSNQLFKFIHSR